jgi:fermentation-respiration switch protein FrsA (DUF1100 family)
MPDPEHATLRAITQPALLVSGSHDTMVPADNAYAMFKALSDAQPILYPDIPIPATACCFRTTRCSSATSGPSWTRNGACPT